MTSFKQLVPAVFLFGLAPATALAERQPNGDADAHTQNQWYVDAGVAMIISEIDLDAYGNESIQHGAISARLGHNVSPSLGFEGEVWAGLGDDTLDEFSSIDLKLNYLVGLFGRARMPLTDNVSGFLRAGVAYSEAEVSSGSISETDIDTAGAIGAGLEHQFNENWYLRGDYTLYLFDGTDTHLLGVSAGYRF